MSSIPVRVLAGAAAAASLAAGCGDNIGLCDPTASNSICTIAGEGTRGFGGDDGPAIDAYLDIPQDMVLDEEGNVWVLDFNNYLIRQVRPDGTIKTVVGTGLLGDSPPVGEPNIAAGEAMFNHTPDLLFHDGYLYVAAWHNSRIKRIELSTMMMENFAGVGRRTLYFGDEGDALEAALDLPSSIAVNAEGHVAIMDQANQVVRLVDEDHVIHRIAGICIVDRDFPCAEGQEPMQCPGSDKLACGPIETECGKECSPSYGGDEGDALMARMAQPAGQDADPAGRIDYTPDGSLIFADSNNHRLRRVDADGIITTFAGTGEAGFAGDGGDATDAMLNNPVDVEVDDEGNVYFTDTYNNCVRMVDTGGVISTVVGKCDSDPASRTFAGDGGPPTEANVALPYGIELFDGGLYVADTFNNRIRIVNF